MAPQVARQPLDWVLSFGRRGVRISTRKSGDKIVRCLFRWISSHLFFYVRFFVCTQKEVFFSSTFPSLVHSDFQPQKVCVVQIQNKFCSSHITRKKICIYRVLRKKTTQRRPLSFRILSVCQNVVQYTFLLFQNDEILCFLCYLTTALQKMILFVISPFSHLNSVPPLYCPPSHTKCALS